MEKIPYTVHCFVCYTFLESLLLNYLYKMHGYSQFSFWISTALAKISFSHIVINGPKKCKCNLFTHEVPKSSRNSFKGVHAFQVELYFRNVGFCGGRKTGEKPLGARTRTDNQLNPHMTPSPGIEPRPQWFQASALTTAPSLFPKLMNARHRVLGETLLE